MIIDDQKKILKMFGDWLVTVQEHLVKISLDKDEENVEKLREYLEKTEKGVLFFDKHVKQVHKEIHERSKDVELKNHAEEYLALWTNIKPLIMNIMEGKTHTINKQLREEIQKLQDVMKHLRELIPKHNGELEASTDR